MGQPCSRFFWGSIKASGANGPSLRKPHCIGTMSGGRYADDEADESEKDQLMDNEDDEEEEAVQEDDEDDDDDPPMNQLDAFASMKAFDALNRESFNAEQDQASSSSSSSQNNDDDAQAMDPAELERQVQQEMEEIKKQMYTDPDCSNNIGRCLRVVRMEDVQVQPCTLSTIFTAVLSPCKN